MFIGNSFARAHPNPYLTFVSNWRKKRRLNFHNRNRAVIKFNVLNNH